MTTPSFPTTLPGVLIGQHSFAPIDTTIRTEMDAGLARTRRRFLGTPTEYDVKWKFTRAQLGTFEKFYANDIANGASWFNIKLVNGAGETTCLARFKGTYSVSSETREFMWLVSAKLEVVTRALIA